MPISRGAATENGTVTMLSPLRGFRSFSITNPGARAPATCCRASGTSETRNFKTHPSGQDFQGFMVNSLFQL